MHKNIKLLEKRICKNQLYTGEAVNFNADDILLPDGRAAVREYLDHPGAVAVLPVLPGNKIIMVRQYRYPVGEATWEIPAGKMHSKRDNPEKRARAELGEETGYSAGRLKKLVTFWPCCAFSNETLHIYSAANLRPGKPNPDDDEFLRTGIIPLDKALRMIKTGEIKDSKTMIALLLHSAG